MLWDRWNGKFGVLLIFDLRISTKKKQQLHLLQKLQASHCLSKFNYYWIRDTTWYVCILLFLSRLIQFLFVSWIWPPWIVGFFACPVPILRNAHPACENAYHIFNDTDPSVYTFCKKLFLKVFKKCNEIFATFILAHSGFSVRPEIQWKCAEVSKVEKTFKSVLQNVSNHYMKRRICSVMIPPLRQTNKQKNNTKTCKFEILQLLPN